MKSESTSSKKYPEFGIRTNLFIIFPVLITIFTWTIQSQVSNRIIYSDPDIYESVWKELDWKEFKLTSIKLTPSGILQLEPKKIVSALSPWKEGNDPQGVLFSGSTSKKQIPTSSFREWASHEIKQKQSMLLSFYPSTQKDRLTLFEKTIFQKGLEYGIRGTIEDQTLRVDLIRFFGDQNGNTSSGTIYSSYRINKRSWNQLALYFDPTELTVKMYLNEKYAGQYKESSLDSIRMGFHTDDNTPLILGSDYYGKMKDLRFISGEPNFPSWNLPYPEVEFNRDSKMVGQPRGEAISPVYRSKLSHTGIRDIQIRDLNSSLDTIWDIQFRFSRKPFARDLTEDELAWNSYRNLHRLPTCEGMEPDQIKSQNIPVNCFQFYQFRVLLRSSPGGTETPSITTVRYNLMHTKPPKKVKTPRIIPDTNGEELKVCLEWKGNEEPNVWKGGTYTIHYGFSEDELSGQIVVPIKERTDTYKQCIDNGIIRAQSEKYRVERNLPFFRRGTTVFFRISAENNFYSEVGFGSDQVSDLSNPVSYSFPF